MIVTSLTVTLKRRFIFPQTFFFLKPQAKGRCAKVKKKKKQNIYSKPKMSSIFYMCRKGKKGGFVKSSLFLGGGLLELIRKVERKSVFKGPSDFFVGNLFLLVVARLCRTQTHGFVFLSDFVFFSVDFCFFLGEAGTF